MKTKLLSECCKAEIYYTGGWHRCGKCNKPVIIILGFNGGLGNKEMPRPKRID